MPDDALATSPYVCARAGPSRPGHPGTERYREVSHRNRIRAVETRGHRSTGFIRLFGNQTSRDRRALWLFRLPPFMMRNALCRWPVGLTTSHAGKHRCKACPRLGAHSDEAPPCMRWRGLALPRCPGQPIARQPLAPRPPPVSRSRRLCRSPDLPAFPGWPRGRIPSSVVRDFYCLPRFQHRPLRDNFKILLSSTGHPLFIPRA
jgi:hypothetical protein